MTERTAPDAARGYKPIGDYALIGDCHGSALVARDGSVDWCCLDRFDADPVLCRILDANRGGFLSVTPLGRFSITRSYADSTNILNSRFHTDAGDVLVTDFMPVGRRMGSGTHNYVELIAPKWLVRTIEATRGSAEIRIRYRPTIEFGAKTARLNIGDGRIVAEGGPVLHHTAGDFTLKDDVAETTAALECGQRLTLVLSNQSALVSLDRVEALKSVTAAFWREWIAYCRYEGPYREAVRRSLLTIKLLIYAPSGAIVAAPTTSLPEEIGGIRNWDYRYCWLRDATLTLLAMMDAGYYDEARAWREWLVRAAAGSPEQMQIMYGIGGERRLPEFELAWLAGYEGSKPVRIGNAAAAQLQLDVYGELMDALWQACKGGLTNHDIAWGLQQALLEHLTKAWVQPDEGIWEIRAPPRHFTYSKIMAWVAFDRAVKMVETFGMTGPVERWRDLRRRIHVDVCRRGFSRKRNAFVQSYGSEELDASLLQIALTGFLPATDPRVVSTVDAIREELTVDGLVMRYRSHESVDGLPRGEGVFLACSFWLADNLCLQGRWDEARELFQRLVGLANDVGLLAEEYDPVARRLLGNFPQAFSHVGLVNTAMNLGNREKPAEQRAEQKAA